MDLQSVVESWSVSSAALRGHRDQLIRFWLSCPDDVLESLWAGSPGSTSREMIAQLSPTTFFTGEQVALRNRLGEFLRDGFQQPGAVKALIATFLLSPPGQFRIVNPESHLPIWLVPSYRSLYEQGQINASTLQQTIQTSSEPSHLSTSLSDKSSDLPSLEFDAFPATLNELLANRIQLNRLLGMSNLYYIDPEDQEIRDELLELRSKLAELILRTDDSSLESSFSTDFADRYWSLVRSGIQSVPLSPEMTQMKEKVKAKLTPSLGGGFSSPGAISAFLVAMMLYEPGSMQVEGAEQKLPAWLFSGYQEIFSVALK